MKLDSKYFDKVRVKPGEERITRDRFPPCDWAGCTQPGRHKAPRGRSEEGKFYNYCLAHVQQYNKTYNYFEGMKDDAIADWQKSAATGHRPTWKLGENSWAMHNGGGRRPDPRLNGLKDPHNLFGKDKTKPREKPGRALRNAELKALHTLGLDETATAEQVKSQYKKLVKRLHPDANNGSRANEETLKAVIHSYDYLRSTGILLTSNAMKVSDRDRLIAAARDVVGDFTCSEYCTAGVVAAALITEAGRVFTGICIDTSSSLGFCAEHAAIAEMLKSRETRISGIVAVHEVGAILPPCGRCRELIRQVDPGNWNTEVIVADDQVVTLGSLLPYSAPSALPPAPAKAAL